MRNAVYGYLAEEDKQSVAAHMRQVMPGMARLMHRPAYDRAVIRCYKCSRAAIGCYHAIWSSKTSPLSHEELSAAAGAMRFASSPFSTAAVTAMASATRRSTSLRHTIPILICFRASAILHAQDRFTLYDDAIAVFVARDRVGAGRFLLPVIAGCVVFGASSLSAA